jgi:putative ABC transport system permease protein
VIPLRLARRNLFRHRLRTLLTLGSVATAVFLITVLRPLVSTLDAGVRQAASNRLIVQSAVSLFVSLPRSYQEKIRAVDGVEEVLKFNWFGGYYQDPKNFFGQFGVDAENLLATYPEIELLSGSEEEFIANRRGCLIGDGLVRRYGWQVGDAVPIIGALYPRLDGEPWDFQVAGIYHSATSNVDNGTLFFHYEYVQEAQDAGAAGGPEGVGVFTLRLAPGADEMAVMADVDGLFENGPQRVQTNREAEFQAQFVSMVGNVPFFVNSIGGGVFLAILLAVLNTMLLAGREQTRDAGVLKALGFTAREVAGMLLTQGLFLGLVGGAMGVGLALVAEPALLSVLGNMFPGYGITLMAASFGLSLALLVGVVSGLAPAYLVSRTSCVESLRAEI